MTDIRCVRHRKHLFAKVVGEPPPHIDRSTNLIEVACRGCKQDMIRNGREVSLVLHRFNVLGELIESEVVP